MLIRVNDYYIGDMNRKIYQTLFMFLEKGKARSRSSYKAVRVYYVLWYYFARFVENVLVRYTPFRYCKLSNDESEERITASLTSYPGRIHVVEFAIKSLLLQSTPPHRLILWLAEAQFPNKELPNSLLRYTKIGVEIRWCDDLRSHKKYFYALQEQKAGELVITFDDDILYHPDSIENVIKKHREYPGTIITNMMMQIVIENDHVLPFRSWGMVLPGKHKPRKDYALLTGSGCLYPYGVMPEDTFNWSEAKRTSLTCDDLWITFMTKLHNVPVCPVDFTSPDFCTAYGSQTTHLAQTNMQNDGNDKSVSLFMTEYPYLVEYMKS